VGAMRGALIVVVRRCRWMLLIATLPMLGALGGCASPAQDSEVIGGYVAVHAVAATSVSASFQVVAVACDGQRSRTSQTVHLGLNFFSASLYYLCLADGTLKYAAEARTGPFDATFAAQDAAVGDDMRVSVTFNADSTVGVSTVRNVTRGWTVTKRSEEAGLTELAYVGTVPVEGYALTESAPMVYRDVRVNGQPLGQADLRELRRVRLTDAFGVVRMVPSAVTNDDRFTNTWRHT